MFLKYTNNVSTVVPKSEQKEVMKQLNKKFKKLNTIQQSTLWTTFRELSP